MREKGYTLLEVLLVLSLITIFLGIAFPKTEYFAKIKERQALEDFRKDLLFARNQAIMESRNYLVYFDVVDNRYGIRPENDLKSVKLTYFTSGIRIDENNKLGSFVFKYNGTTKNSGTLYLRNQKNQKIEVKLRPVTGSINIEISGSK